MTPPTFWQSLLRSLAKNPISFFAVLCVSATAAFLGAMTWRMVAVLESPDWCSKALQAERISISTEKAGGLTSCVSLLTTQLEAVATGFHISTGGFVFVLIVLIVVVVAGAKASGKLTQNGLDFDIGRDPAAKAADQMVDAAKDEAAHIKGDV